MLETNFHLFVLEKDLQRLQQQEIARHAATQQANKNLFHNLTGWLRKANDAANREQAHTIGR